MNRAALEAAQRKALKLQAEAGKNKFGAKRTIVDGIAFDSKAESRRWVQLKAMERRGLISGLLRQVPYRLEVLGVLIAIYKADFVYVDQAGREVVEDVKCEATITPAYRIKKRLMQAIHGITVEEHMV